MRDWGRMPLSEEEQRILRQIEHQLRSDPTFSSRGYRVSRVRLFGLFVALVIGIALTVAGISVNAWLAFAGFLGVLLIAVLLERELRVIGREKFGQLPMSAWFGVVSRPRDGHRSDNPDESSSDRDSEH